ncbi:MAG: thioredoxin family protein [candidate division Zixibacteria bacterium]|nr:thioredoxin family protein [candidate division Zixibacteria bacterium]
MRKLRPVAIALLLIVCFTITQSTAQMDFSAGGSVGNDFDEEFVVLEAVFSISSALPGKTYSAAATAIILPKWHINSATPHEDWLIPAKLEIDSLPNLTPHSIVYPAGHEFDLAGSIMSTYSNKVIIPFSVTLAPDLADGEYDLPIRFAYQPCNDKQCLAPQTVEATLHIVIGEEGRPTHEDIFATAVDVPETDGATTSGPVEENQIQRLIDDYGAWGYVIALGLAFLTGLLLSFSPCTYPMIPITVSVFAGQSRSVWRGFMLSLVYVGSMAFVYGIMGLVVSLVGGVFGAWLASTPVVIGIAIIFIVFALSMFGLFELQVPSALRQMMGTKTKETGIGSSILLGIVAALVVSPCVGPFVAGILLYVALSGSPVIGFLVLFVFALGLGTLYVLVATFSSAINNLPGSGAWMESVKKFFGFILLLMALYFLRTIISPTVAALLTGLLLVSYGVFGGGLDRLTSEASFFVRLKKLLGLLALLVGFYLLGGTIISQGLIWPPADEWLPSTSQSERGANTELIHWETDLDRGLAKAATEGRPVLVDTWATWCANCRVLDKKTFGNPDVATALQRFVAIKVQLEKAGTPTTLNFMERFNMKHYSLPTTLLIGSDGNVKRVLQGVVDPDDMIAELRQIK